MRVEQGVNVDDESSKILRVVLPFGCNPQIHQSWGQRKISHQGHWTKEAPHHQIGGYSPKLKDPIHGDTIYIKTQVFRLLRYYSPAPRNIARSDWATQNITHNMTYQ